MVEFIIIGNGNAVTYKEIFPLIKENKVWIGCKSFSGGMDMLAGKNYDPNKCKHPKYDERGNLIINVMMCVWFTNVEHSRRNSPITLYKTYSADKYPKYENYDAIEVSRTENIPMDYEGVMGVPITFLDKYCPTQFEIIGMAEDNGKGYSYGANWDGLNPHCVVNGKNMYKRILIRKKKNEEIVEYGKKFLIIGNKNAITYKEIFPYIKNNELWLGCSSFNSGMYFKVPNDYEYADTYKFDRDRNGERVMRVSSICWFTNIPHNSRNIELDLYKKYSADEYPKYDNYDAIEVSRTENIPMDYDGVMGVPITFLDKYCPAQFEIVSSSDFAIDDIEGWKGVSEEFYELYYKQGNKGLIKVGWALPHYIENGIAKIPYKRILIRRI